MSLREITFLFAISLFFCPSPATAQSSMTNTLPQIIKKIPSGKTKAYLSSIPKLLMKKSASEKVYYIVRGYYKKGDGGGGVFRYHKSHKAKADGGTVLKGIFLPGKFIRMYHPRGDVYAEWFGAQRNGDSANPKDDRRAIQKCLDKFKRIRLLEGTYGVGIMPPPKHSSHSFQALALRSHYRIEGAGQKKSVIKLLDGTNPHGNNPNNYRFTIISNYNPHKSAEKVRIRDLTVDGNYDGQDGRSTIHCIGIYGGDALVERVSFRGFGTGVPPGGGTSKECFALHQGLVYKDKSSSRKAATFRDLHFTAPGHNGALKGSRAEITLIAIGGANNFNDRKWALNNKPDPNFDPSNGGENKNNWWPSYGGLIENCTFANMKYNNLQKSPLHGITYADCIGLRIQKNKFYDYEGDCIYVMSWWNKNTLIRKNKFYNVLRGLTLHVKKKKNNPGIPSQNPRHMNLRFELNSIKLGTPKNAKWTVAGINIYGENAGKEVRFKNIYIRRNYISGRAFKNKAGETKYPMGILFQVPYRIYDGIVISRNIIDVPHYDRSVKYIPNTPHSMSMVYHPLRFWIKDKQSKAIVFKNNRTPKGKKIYPILANASFDNSPQWGK